MGFQVNRTEISNGIYFTEITDAKFKNNRISATLVSPLCEETAAAHAILPLILKKGYRGCPDAAEFSKLLNSLYGAVCDGNVRKAGDDQLITLSISAIDDRFTLENEQITAEISKILCSVLLDPVIEDGGFSNKTFETEKQSLIDAIKAELNDKVALASARCQQIMYEGHPAQTSRFGSLESAENLTRRDAFDAYNTLLKKARIEILFTGGGNSTAAREIFTECFKSSAEREEPYKIGSKILKPTPGLKEQLENYSITQAKLSMGFTCQTAIGDEGAAAMSFMSILFGGTPFSKLFLNVREKLSLCYYCSAAYDQFKGAIIVNSGIETENREKAEREILNQLEALQNGEISDEEIENTKRFLNNTYTGISDSIGKLEQFFLPRAIFSSLKTPQDILDDFNALTREDIIDAARKVSLDTVYFMAPKEEK